MDHYEILETKVVIKQSVLQGSEREQLQRVATVYVNGQEFRVWAPSEAVGNAVDWVPHLRVRKPDDINSEIAVPADVAKYVIEKLKQELTKSPKHETQVISLSESPPVRQIQVFISHSSADVAIARELINLLRSAIPALPPEAIRCTSVPGYRLEGGAKTDDQIPKELLGAAVFIGLLSRGAVQSTYVLFELGARWGAQKYLVPLTVAGMRPSELKPPLSGLNAHSADIEPHLFQLVAEVAEKLGLHPAKPQVYAEHVKKLVQASQQNIQGSNGPAPLVPAGPTFPDPSIKTSDGASIIKDALLADLISELDDNLSHAKARRIGDTYLKPSTQAWRDNRNRLKLPQLLRSDMDQIYREIEGWRQIVESGVHPNMGSPALENTTASLATRLPSVIQQLRALQSVS